LSAVEFLKQLSLKGVRVEFTNGKLVIKAEKGCMTPEIMSQLKANKDVLNQFFIATGSAKKTTRASISLAPIMAEYPLSPAQRRLWLAEQVYGSSSTYHMPLVARLIGKVVAPRLQSAIEKVIEKHEILRTIYRDVNGDIKQVVDTVANFTLPFKTVTESEEQLVSQVQKWVDEPFKLTEQWPIRMALWQVAEDSFVLLGCVHHIACDGWSLGILQQDLAEAYNTQNTLQPLAIQYKDYAVWCDSKIQQQSLDDFWREYLSDIPDVHQLPTSNAEQGRMNAIGAKHLREIDDTLSQTINQTCITLNITPFVFYRSVFALLISRFSRQNDVLLGAPESGREIGNIEPLIGFFVNTLVFRHQFDNNELIVRDWLIAEQASTLNVMEYKQLAFELLPSLLGMNRESRHHPIFQLMFSMQNTPSSTVNFDGFAVAPFQGDHAVAKFDITLDIVKGKKGYFSHWEYNKAIFAPTFIETMSQAYTYLLETICNGLDASLAEISTNTYSPITTGTLKQASENFITRIFSQPTNDIALVDQFLTTSFGELSSQVASIYDQLSDIAKPSCVAIWQDRSASYVASLLAIWCAGHIAVPLEKSLAEARLTHILDDADVSVIIGDEHLNLPHTRFISSNIQQQSTSTPWLNTHAQIGGFLIYTSGSTGKSKGVQVSCTSLDTHLNSLSTVFPYLGEENILHFTNFSVDTALEQLLMGLMQGATIIIKPDELWDSRTFWSKVAEHQITCVDLPPSYLVTMMAEQGSASLFLQSTLKYIVLGGESFPEAVAEFWQQNGLWGKIELWNAYGPTEATITATLKQIKESDTRPIALGRLLPGRRALVVDQVGQPLPRHIPGELWLGGQSLAKGYINNSAQTVARFIEKEHERYYRTGDIVSCDSANEFYFKGREDNQVKVKGYRVELEEVETTILSIEGIEQAVVILKNSGMPDAFLVAYYSGIPKDHVTIRGQLSKSLPHYMVPKYIESMTQWPLLTNGKVDRQALQSAVLQVKKQNKNTNAKLPQDHKQLALANVWQSILQVSDVDITESFFAAGGDSISAIKLVGELARVGWKITAKDIFVEHTIVGISQKMIKLSESERYENISGDVPLLPIQKSFLDEQNQHWLQFNQAVGIKLHINVDETKLGLAIDVLASQHDVLRMGITQNEDQVTVSVNDKINSVDAMIHRYTIDDFASAKWQSIVNKHQAAFLSPSDCLWQLLLVEHSSEQQQYLVWICHHFIIDAVSWQVLLTDFAAVIQSIDIGNAGVLPDKTAPITLWHEKLSAWGHKLDSKIHSYWQEQIVDFNQASFSILAEENVASTQVVSSLLPNNIIEEFLKLGRQKLAMTDQELLLALFSQAIGHSLNINKIAFVMENQGRLAHQDLPDVSRTLGWFTATYPFVSYLSTDPLADLVQLKDRFRTVPDQGLSFSVLKHIATNDVSLDWRTHTAICFNFFGKTHHKKHQNETPFSPANIPLGNNQHPALKRSFAMAINCSLTEDGLQYSIDYGESAFTRDTIVLLNNELANIAKSFVLVLNETKQQQTLSDFQLVDISSATLKDVLQQFDKIDALYPATPMQYGMVYHALMDDIDVYVPQSHVRFSGEFDATIFLTAWQNIIARYQVLRSCFYLADEQVLHVILPSSDMPVSIKQRDQISGDIEAYKDSIASQGFDLTSAPLMRLDIVNQNEFVDVIWTHHHSILDGWSIPIIFNELMAVYLDLLVGKEPEEHYPCQYGRYILWLNQQDKSQALNYWHQQLSLLENKSELGFEYQSARNNLGYITQDLKCSDSLTQQLVVYAKKHNVTLNTLIQASWAWLVAKYSGESVVCYGTTVSGRPNEVTNAQNMVGLFINSLPVVTQVDDSQSISNWLQSLQLTLSACEQYGFVPLTDIASTVDKRGVDLFEALFIFENYPRDVTAAQGSDDAAVKITKQQTKEHTNYPLTIMVAADNQLHIRLVLDGEKQTAEWLSYMRSQWHELLQGIVNESWTNVGQWSLPSAPPKPNDSQRVNSLSLELFNKLSQTHHQQTITCGVEKFTYADIGQQVTDLFGYLSPKGIKRVGLHLKRSEKLLSSILGCLVSGVTFVPLDPVFPKERLKAITHEAQLDLVITDSFIPETFCELAIITWADIPKYVGAIDVYDKPFSAYIMFTSGSTGKPKGVDISINALSHFLLACQAKLNINQSAHFLATTTYAFDISLLELLLPIMQGSNLTIATDQQHKNPDELIALLASTADINMLQGTPSFWRMLFAGGWTGPLTGQLILSGGEELTQELAKKLCQHGAKVYNCYGPTEATIWSMMAIVSGTDKLRLSGSLSGYQHLVLDKQNHILASGMIGELCIASDALAEGYWNNEVLTKDKFFMHPTAQRRLYRTGDLVRIISDDNFEFLGRIDEQIKLRGFRIELGEIGAALELIEGISEACAQVKQINGELQIVAYIVSTQAVQSADIQRRLRKVLPHYMVPLFIEKLSVLPKNNNGKVDKKQLPEPSTLIDSVRTLVAPQNHRQEKLLALWQQILKRDDVSIDDTFHFLGGNSLQLVSLLALLRKNINVDIRLQQLSGPLTIQILDERLDETNQVTSFLEPLISLEHNKSLYLLPPLSGFWENTNLLSNVVTSTFNVTGIQLGYLLVDSTAGQIVELVAQAIVDEGQQEIYLGAYSLGGIWITSLIEAIERKGKSVKAIILLDCGHPDVMKAQPVTELVESMLSVVSATLDSEQLNLADRIRKCQSVQDVKILRSQSQDALEIEFLNRLLVMLKHNECINGVAQTVGLNTPTYYIAPRTTGAIDPHIQAWRKNFSQLMRLNVDGNHQSMMTAPNNQSLFIQLEKELKHD
jgi:amino acid adenylation domain-containing protein/non-ribosomal peptide synthase protein (TIGR01720 family)